MTIKNWPDDERPQEKLLQQGSQSLSDAELLALFLRSGLPGMSAVALSREMLTRFGSLRALLDANQRAFCATRGVGIVRFVQLQAALELSRRHMAASIVQGQVMSSPTLVREYLRAQLRDLRHEVFAALLLDAQHRVIRFEHLSVGTIDSAIVYPREVAKQVLAHHACAVIFAHNHPSGNPEPSQADRKLTKRLVSGLALLDIRVLDHLVIGDPDIVSFAERGWL